MKKLAILIISLLTLFTLFGCNKNKDITAKEVADSIADISTDNEGNVMVTLINGKTFSLGNLKGEKGEKGDKGDKGDVGPQGPAGPQGPQGLQGVAGVSGSNGRDGANGKDGINGKDGKDGEIPTDYLKNLVIDDKGRVTLQYGDDSEEYIKRVETKGKWNVIKIRYHVGDETQEDYFPNGSPYWADDGKPLQMDLGYKYIDSNYYNGRIKLSDVNYVLTSVKCENASLTPVHEPAFGTMNFNRQGGYTSLDLIVSYTLASMPAKDVYLDYYYEPVSEDHPIVVQLPYSTFTKEEIKAWCDTFGIAKYTESIPDSTHPEGSFSIYDSNGNSYNPGSQISMVTPLDLTLIYYTGTSVALPTTGSSLNAVEEWCARYFFANFSVQTTMDPNIINTFTITDSNGVAYSPGSTVTISYGLTLNIVFYIEKPATIVIAPVVNEETNEGSLTPITDDASYFLRWDYPSSITGIQIYENEHHELRLILNEFTQSVDSFTISAYATRDGSTSLASDSVTVNVTNGKLSFE